MCHANAGIALVRLPHVRRECGLQEAGVFVRLAAWLRRHRDAQRQGIMRLGRRVATITPRSHTMSEAVALMTGATSFKTDG
jgi:hypothetical protein